VPPLVVVLVLAFVVGIVAAEAGEGPDERANCVDHKARGYAVLAQERIGPYPASGPAEALWGVLVSGKGRSDPKGKVRALHPTRGIPRDESLG